MHTLIGSAGAWTAAAVIAAPPIARHLGRDCTCGHHRDAHAHYRAGTDCSLCDCGKLDVARVA